MSNKTLNVTLIMRNDTAANWASKNPVLTLGELGVETDTRKFKIGDGTTAYNSLKYGLGGNVEVKSTAPTASDVGYDIGTLWVDTTGTKAYILFAKTANAATWIGLLDSQGKIDKATLADEAIKLQTARTIKFSGAVVANSKTFDGSGDVEYVLVLANSGVSAGTYTKVTVNAKGIITSATQLTAADIPALTLSKISDAGTAASKNTGTAAGNVPVLDANAKIAVALIPSLTLSKISDAGTAAGKNSVRRRATFPCLVATENSTKVCSPQSRLPKLLSLTVKPQCSRFPRNAATWQSARTKTSLTYLTPIIRPCLQIGFGCAPPIVRCFR